ncbi:Ribosomal S4P [Arsukibacterium tuosuense]|uniref:Ribosomal S4P n=1 Tax=Arsukibacterium tuosuense TaxID=1323745 RepID=A0A285IU78_9GAMM|nr:VC2046/SO_2500 family protein [Arsukibacterium tuosuense]SNY50646.1 Ribosomal S4P [Arsukibacterium tuosuense]
MTTIINEWQLDCRLNKAINQQHRADFALWLAFLSPAIDEMAEFQTPKTESAAESTNLYTRFSLPQPRGYGWQEHDIARLNQHSQALNSGGVRQLKMQQYLAEGPLVLADDKAKLASEVVQNLDAHSKRRRDGGEVNRTEADPTALYEMLQQMQHRAA